MYELPYRPQTEGWAPGAVYAAMVDFLNQADRRVDARDALIEKINAVGHATVLHVHHDKNEVPHLTELLCATFIVDHDTGAVLGWCDEHFGYRFRDRPEVMMISTVPDKQSASDIDDALRMTARAFGLFAFPINWYNVFPLSLFLDGSREKFVHYLNRLHQLGTI